MARIVVIGGGWGGCAAAVAARKAGAQVALIERTDLLLGTGLVGGIMKNNGRFTATEEMRFLGGGDLFEIIEAMTRHTHIDFPGHAHASLYDVKRIEPVVRSYLLDIGIELFMETRGIEVVREGEKLLSVSTKGPGFDGSVAGDAFVDATGTAGPAANCVRFGSGCAMCILRCPSFGPRVSIASKAGVNEDGRHIYEAISGSCKLAKESLARWLVEKLDREGLAVLPIPRYMGKTGNLRLKACQQYALPEYEENVILLDTGAAKLMAPFFPLEQLRKIKGLENARFEDPLAGSRGNSVRYTTVTPREDTLCVVGVENLFVAGEKAGLLVGHTEAIVTGTLAGHNAVRKAVRKNPVLLPESLAVGDLISFARRDLSAHGDRPRKYTFSGSVYFARMQELNLYTTSTGVIEDRVWATGLTGVFAKTVV